MLNTISTNYIFSEKKTWKKYMNKEELRERCSRKGFIYKNIHSPLIGGNKVSALNLALIGEFVFFILRICLERVSNVN